MLRYAWPAVTVHCCSLPRTADSHPTVCLVGGGSVSSEVHPCRSVAGARCTITRSLGSSSDFHRGSAPSLPLRIGQSSAVLVSALSQPL
ncbi:hypothetical protein SSCG_01008 [Streptomyces clavuligerus]|nr:hypothetical protein SSCG_01008 [Streptomyces clavuligerus]